MVSLDFVWGIQHLHSHIRLGFCSMDDSEFPSAWMWMGKVAPPQAQLEAVPRKELLAALQRNQHKPLTLVVSAAGFGKTTLLAQWRVRLLQEHAASPTAWLSFDEADAEVNRFLAYLICALQAAGLDVGGLAALAQSQTLDVRPQRTVTALLQLLASDGRRVTLMMDDYHRASNSAVDEVVLTLLERGSQWLHLVVASRMRPAWPLARLKSQGLVHELGASDLMLSPAEAAQIFGVHLGEPALASLHEKTEGWAVAVQLAHHWLAGANGSLFGLQSFSGRVADVAEYLTEQIFENLSEECRAFLLETSLLERFNAELADVVRGREDSAQLLAQLSAFDALLVPLDSHRSWFRYHMLLADFLRPRLDIPRSQRIHQAAAHWLAVQTDWVLAVSHALRAKDTVLAVNLVVRAGGWELVLRKGISYAQSLLQQFDEQARSSEPDLLLMQAYLHAKLGNRALSTELLRLAKVAVRGDERLERDFAVIQGLTQAYFDQFDNEQGALSGADWAGSALALATLQCVRAMSCLAYPNLPEALRVARAARLQMRMVASPLGENYCLIHEAQALSLTGEVSGAGVLIDEALCMAQENFGSESSLKAVVGCFKAQHLYWQGAWAEVQPLIREGWDSLEHTDGWLDVFAATAEVSWRTALRALGVQPALAELEKIARIANDRQLDRLTRLVHAWRIDLLAQSGLVSQARQELQLHRFDTLPADELDWRNREAVGLALARLLLASGASAAALARLERDIEALLQKGLILPVWRLRIMAMLARYKVRGELDAEEVSGTLLPVVGQGLMGLLLEVGPALLPMLDVLPDAFPGMSSVITRLRGWRAHPVRPRAHISAKEMQLLTLLAGGQSNKAIALALDISENTVKFHLKQIFRKLEVENRSAAISTALREGLLDPRA